MMWGEAIEYLAKYSNVNYRTNFCLSGNGLANEESHKLVKKVLYLKNWYTEVKKFYENITAKLIKEYFYKISFKYQVDIVQNIAALVNMHFSMSLFSLPLKTEEHPHGIYIE